jgi:hypothetical protein
MCCKAGGVVGCYVLLYVLYLDNLVGERELLQQNMLLAPPLLNYVDTIS